MRWLWSLTTVVVLAALGAFFWPTFHRTMVAWQVEAPPPAPAPTGLAAPPPASVAETSPSTPSLAPVAQSSPPVTAPAPSSQTSPSAPAPAQTPAPTPVAQTAPSAAPLAPAAQAPAPASTGATAGVASAASPGSIDKAASELASLKPGFGAGDLVSALNRSKFNFAFASAEVPPEMADFLKRAADKMKRLPPGHVLEIAGYTDSSGNPAKNVTLSQKRAEAVRRALIEEGANADTLVAKGYGSADPIASNDTPEGRLRNRRIEFHVVRTP
jgi:outer membrane protein OmpA-like peptidoglycan-associated protein